MQVRNLGTRLRPLAVGASLALALPLVGLAATASAVPTSTSASTEQGSPALRSIDGRYLVTLAGAEGTAGFDAVGTDSAVRALVTSAGGTIVNDLSRQIGVLVVESTAPAFVAAMEASPLIDSVGSDFAVKVYGNDAPEPSADPMEALQWDMQQIRTEEAHAVQAGLPAVDVGVLDSGIDGRHPDFLKGADSNVDCARGRDSLAALPPGVAVGTPDPCTDNQFHGTHVAGTIGARANGHGIVGVAPNVTLVPVKVCDSTGYCYASPVVDGITYSGDEQFDVINMSFFVDDNSFQESTEFKCSSDPVQRTFRQAVERALSYARNRGVTPVAALGNSDQDLAHPVDDSGQPISNECEVVPAESQGVIGTVSLGSKSEKAGYSNYGTGMADISAPGGNGTTGDCRTTILSTIPGGYLCIQGTSMASPHAAGVAALIVSQFGRARQRRRHEAAAADGGELPAGDGGGHRAAGLRRVLRQRPDRRAARRHQGHLEAARRVGAVLPGVHRVRHAAGLSTSTDGGCSSFGQSERVRSIVPLTRGARMNAPVGYGTTITTHRPWSSLLLASYVVVAVLAVVGVVGGLTMVVADFADRSDSWDGVMAFIGGAIAVACAVVGGVAGVLAAATRRGQRKADTGDASLLRGVAITTVVLGAFALLVSALTVAPALVGAQGFFSLTGLVLLLPAVLAVTAAAGTLRAIRS